MCLNLRQARGEMADDVIAAAHPGDQRSLPAVPVGRTPLHAEPRAFSAQKNPHCVQLQHGAAQLLHLQRGLFSSFLSIHLNLVGPIRHSCMDASWVMR